MSFFKTIIISLIPVMALTQNLQQLKTLNSTFYVNTEITSEHFGSIEKISSGSSNLEEMIFQLPFSYSERKILFSSDTLLQLECKNSLENGSNALIEFSTHDSRLLYKIKIWGDKEISYKNGLNLLCQSEMDSIETANPGMLASATNLQSPAYKTSDCESIVSLRNPSQYITFMIRNPYHSSWSFTGAGKYQLDVLRNMTFEVNEQLAPKFEKSPESYSIVSANDTITRSVELSVNTPISAPVSFSEQPHGFDQTITMYWDELPSTGDLWKFMTTADNDTDTKFDYLWLKLLRDHPKMKMGYLLLTDKLMWKENSSFSKWTFESQQILKDTLSEYQGESCISFISFGPQTLKMYQEIDCSPNTEYELSYFIKTDSVIGHGAYGEAYGFPNCKLLNYGPATTGTTEWSEKKTSILTGETDTKLRIYLRLQNAQGVALFDSVKVVEKGSNTNLIVNGNFERGWSSFMYTNERRHWSDARGMCDISQKAPVEYHNFLQRIENDELLYGWEDRINLGSHGLHHTPNIDVNLSLPKPGPEWEFQHFDPHGDELRLKRIVEDTYAMGLTDKSLRYFRSAGLQFTKSLIDELFKYEFVFLDIGRRKNYTSTFLQNTNKRLWMVSHCWWADGIKEDPAILYNFLKRGHMGHLGGHPIFTLMNEDFSSPEYERINKFFTDLENHFPNLGYLFPDEYADHAEAMYSIVVDSVISKDNGTNLYFTGVTPEGATLLINGTAEKITIDNSAANMRIDNDRTIVVLPALGEGQHVLKLINTKFNKATSIINTTIVKRESKISLDAGTLSLKLEMNSDAVSNVKIFNLKGQCLVNESVPLSKGTALIDLNKFKLSKGMYIISIAEKTSGFNKTVKYLK